MAEQFLKSSGTLFPCTILRLVKIYEPGQLGVLYDICQITSRGFQFNIRDGEITFYIKRKP